MNSTSFSFATREGPEIFVRHWSPPQGTPRAVMLLAHGAAEHSQRYARLAALLVAENYAVYAPDHRGHGRTLQSIDAAGNAGPDGFNGMVRDLKQLADSIRAQHASTSLFLLGHSMGAALAQRFIQLHGEILRGVILSGSPGLQPNLEQAAATTAQLAQGAAAEQPSQVFAQIFASFNKGFEPAETASDWLSRDATEVKRYVDDPWCGFAFTNRLVAEMSQTALAAAQPENIARIPKSLPIFLFSGTQDRVSGNGKYLEQLLRCYRDAGIQDIEVKLYAEGRHEMLNETNRDEVHRDLLVWLSRHV